MGVLRLVEKVNRGEVGVGAGTVCSIPSFQPLCHYLAHALGGTVPFLRAGCWVSGVSQQRVAAGFICSWVMLTG